MEVGLIATALGAVVGLIIALSGAGGGILAVPLLVFGLHLGVAQAAPVSLIAVGTASALGAVLGLRERIVRYRAAMLIGSVGMLTAPLGLRLAHWIPNAPLTLAFAVVLAYVAVRMFTQSRRNSTIARAGRAAVRRCRLSAIDGRLVWTRPCALAMASTGAVSGLLSGLLGVGGGFVIVPSLTRFTDLPARSIVATSMAVIALVSVSGVSAAAAQGSIDWHIALPFATGAVAALLAGRQVAARVAGSVLQRAFAITSAVVAVLMLTRGLASILG